MEKNLKCGPLLIECLETFKSPPYIQPRGRSLKALQKSVTEVGQGNCFKMFTTLIFCLLNTSNIIIHLLVPLNIYFNIGQAFRLIYVSEAILAEMAF
jgi:hypothetical protein